MTKKYLVLVFALLQLIAIQAAKAEECACDRYLTFIPEYSLADSVVAAGAAVLHLEGHQFNVDAEVADALIRRIHDDIRIPAECRGYVKSRVHVGPKFSLSLTGGYGGRAPDFSMNGDYTNGLMGAFNGMLANYNPCQRPPAGTPADAYIACIKANSGAAYQKFTQRLANASSGDLVAQLNGYGITVTPADVVLLKAYNDALNSGSAANLIAWSGGAGKKLSVDQFLNVVQMMGWEMNNTYNFDRADKKRGQNKGVKTVDQVLASLKTDTIFMINGRDDLAGSLGDFEPVCRDAAIMQVQMLRARDMPNSFAVRYNSTGDGHVDVITQDPKDPLKLYTLNWYGRATHSGLDGSQALFQGSGMGIPDYTASYTISDWTGKNVADIPSGMGKFLIEASGGNVNTWDPLARSNNSILAVSLSPDSRGAIQIRALNGTDTNGAMYTGVAADAHWGVGSNYPGQAGLFVGNQFRPMGAYGASANGTAFVGMVQAEQHIMTSKLTLLPGVTGLIDVHGAASGLLTVATSGPDVSNTESNTNGQFNHRIGVEARIDQVALGGRLRLQYVGGGNIMIGQSDVRDESAASLTAIPLGLYVGARATLNVGDVILFGQAKFAVDQLGSRDRVEAGFATRALAVSAYESGRMADGTALIQDGTIRRMGVAVTAAPSKHLRFSLTGEVPIEGDWRAGTNIYASGAVIY
ncbi:MAG: hypothetical protein HY074_12595 [Deltaproteobacteria bacterium]|nr:hypothetical protein [Deltaproteobacteria bacterium]